MALLAISKPKFEPGERLLKRIRLASFVPLLERLGLGDRGRAADGALSPAHHLVVTLNSFCRPALVEPGPRTPPTPATPDFPIDRLAPQDREGDARHLVGKRYGDKLEGLLLDQFLRPHPQWVGVRLTVKQHGVRAHDEQFAQVAIAHFRNAPEFLLAARRILLGSQSRKAAFWCNTGSAEAKMAASTLDIRWNFGDAVTGQTGRLFLPFDGRIRKKFSDLFNVSLEVGARSTRSTIS